MARTPTDKKAVMLDRVESARADGEITDADAEAILELCRAYDEDNVKVPKPDGERFRSERTIGGWAERLTTLARELDGQLVDTDADAINHLMQQYHDDDGKGLAKNTVRNYQNTARRFFRYHDSLGVDAGDISVYAREGKKWDPEDVLTRKEIDRVREACTNARDNLIFHLLLYTGQRNTALRTLRVKDVKVDAGKTGRYRLNPEHGGLKRADKNGEWRPLLAAEGAVRDWLRYHPDPEPENYLITQRPSSNHLDPTEPVSRELLRRLMHKLADDVGIDKPMHPHMMRHNFVTICKRDYDMDNDTIKWLIGHAPDSKVMETTYAHLSDEDWIERAEVAANYREPEEPDSPLTPPSCDNCGRSLADDAKVCDGCGMGLTPDVKGIHDSVQREAGEAKALAGLSDNVDLTAEEIEAVAENDAIMAKLIELRADQQAE